MSRVIVFGLKANSRFAVGWCKPRDPRMALVQFVQQRLNFGRAGLQVFQRSVSEAVNDPEIGARRKSVFTERHEGHIAGGAVFLRHVEPDGYPVNRQPVVLEGKHEAFLPDERQANAGIAQQLERPCAGGQDALVARQGLLIPIRPGEARRLVLPGCGAGARGAPVRARRTLRSTGGKLRVPWRIRIGKFG
jgi:hypothetical protein